MMKKMSRRSFLRAGAFASTGLVLASCAPALTPTPEAPTAVVEEAAATAAPTVAATEVPSSPEIILPKAPSTKVGDLTCEQEWTTKYPPVPKKYDPPVEISTTGNTDVPYIEGVSARDNPAHNELLEYMGLDVYPEYEASGDLATQKFDAMVASGKLVDMMFLAGTGLADLVNQGAIADIKDIWERTASDLVKEKKKYANDSRNWFHVLRNGGSEVYGIPFNHGPAYNVDNLGWIRKDLLDEAGLSVPETLDQLETALYAFKDKGLTEYGINCCKNLVTWYNSLDPIFAAYGVMPTFWMKRGSTPLTYGSTLPEVKDVLARLAKWYKDGIIHPDYYTFGEGDADANITSGKVGAFFSAHWVVPGTLTMAEQGLNCQFAMMPSPKGPSGLMGRKSSGISDNAICFAHDIDPIKIEAAINWLNWQTERAVNIDRNNDYGMLGPDISEYMFNQGIGWVWDDAASECKIKTGPGQWSAWWTYYGFHYPGYYWDEFQAEAAEVVMSWAKKDPVDLNSVQKWILAPERNILRFLEAYKHNIDTGKERIENEWYGIPGESMLEFSGDLGTLEAEAFTAIVTGQKPLEAFDQFVTDWYSNGGNEITMEVNEWYKNKS